MTREYILQNLEAACPIWFIDNPQLRDEVMATLQDSLLIPKPKFKVGDRVQVINREWQYNIAERYFDPDKEKWFYQSSLCWLVSIYAEDSLELAEEKNEIQN